MGVSNNIYIKGFIFLTIIFPLVCNCERDCKTFKKNVSVCKLLTACQLLVKNNVTICGDLKVTGTLNVGTGTPFVGSGPVFSDYAYVYNTNRPIIAINGTVNFTTNGPLSGFTHIAGTDQITVINPGVYVINFYLSSYGQNRVEVYVNGSALPQHPSSYSLTDSEAGKNFGQCILQLSANDVITLVNTSGVALPLTGGVVTASIMIERLA
jgi:hypothetical protein